MLIQSVILCKENFKILLPSFCISIRGLQTVLRTIFLHFWIKISMLEDSTAFKFIPYLILKDSDSCKNELIPRTRRFFLIWRKTLQQRSWIKKLFSSLLFSTQVCQKKTMLKFRLTHSFPMYPFSFSFKVEHLWWLLLNIETQYWKCVRRFKLLETFLWWKTP